MSTVASVWLLLALGSAAQAQPPSFVYPPPAPDSFHVTRNVQYGTDGGTVLRMDVYRPAGGGAAPALIFFNLASGEQRASPFYVSWAQFAASRGITAVVPDLRFESFAGDFEKLLAYVTAESAVLGIDHDAIAVYAGSGNVSRALPLVQNARARTVRAAVMYYGSADLHEFRPDLPVLFVRAGLDRPALNHAIDELAGAALARNAPWTLLNHASGRHAFEIRNDDDVTRRVIDETLEFVRTATSSSYQMALRDGLPEARAAGQVTAGRFGDAARAYAELVTRRPDDATLKLAYGEALLADAQFAAACAVFDTLRGKGLGFRDLGLPAARACMQKGDAGAAIAWLASIPERFRPDVQDDPIFAPIRDREDFKALFRPR